MGEHKICIHHGLLRELCSSGLSQGPRLMGLPLYMCFSGGCSSERTIWIIRYCLLKTFVWKCRPPFLLLTDACIRLCLTSNGGGKCHHTTFGQMPVPKKGELTQPASGHQLLSLLFLLQAKYPPLSVSDKPKVPSTYSIKPKDKNLGWYLVL